MSYMDTLETQEAYLYKGRIWKHVNYGSFESNQSILNFKNLFLTLFLSVLFCNIRTKIHRVIMRLFYYEIVFKLKTKPSICN
jgi:hypothetical protein